MKKLKMERWALAGAVLLVMFAAGCYNNLDSEYEETEGGYHPFEDPAVIGHQEYLETVDYDFSACTECHGEDLAGVASGPGGSMVRSCYACHSAINHPGNLESSEDHVEYLRSVNFDMDECWNCHATTTDALFGGSCSSSSCHSASNNGPNACNVCHGDFTGDPTEEASWAPPQGLDGVVSLTDPGVGAHQAHMNVDTDNFAQVACAACHLVPSTVGFSDHIDVSTPGVAELNFGDIAENDGANPEYDADNATCSSTYCHGDAEPEWMVIDGTYNSCGTCHGDADTADPNPHSAVYAVTDCATCHGSVIDATGSIIDGSLHVNGNVNN